MGKPADAVELRIFLDPETKKYVKAQAATKGLTITEFFKEMLYDYKRQRHERITAN